jgi:hypothetical protein
MACESMRKPNQTKEQRQAEVKAALKTLELKLQTGKVTITIGPQGAVLFTSWSPVERADLTDACAYRTLQSQGSWALKQAVMQAEARSGRKVNAAAVAGGVHSHDGGKTWHPGH